MRSSKITATALRAMLSAWALLTVMGCQDGPFIRLTVDGRSPDINRLKFIGSISGQTVPKNFDKLTDLSTITVSLPAGARGLLDITIEGYFNKESDCIVSRGKDSVNITDDEVYLRTISLEAISTCGRGTYSLTVENDPPDAGAVNIMPRALSSLPLSCGKACSAWFPEGTTVSLTAMPVPGYSFQGWSNTANCGSNPACSVVLGENLIVRAQYAACTGWCNEAPGSATNTLYSVHGNSTNNIIAAGAAGTILEWDGTSWSADQSDTNMALRAVTSRPGGGDFSAGDNGAIVTRKMGKIWYSVKNNLAEQINGILETQLNGVFVVGNNGTLLTGDITSKLTPICPLMVGTTSVNAISSLPNTSVAFVVGEGGLFIRISSILGIRLCTVLPSGTMDDLLGLWVSAKNIYLVGEKGTIIKCANDGTSCTPLPSLVGGTVTLHGIWGSANDTYLYAVGDDGVILKSSTGGMLWELEQTGVRNNLYAVWGADARTVYAVGQDGIILRFR